MYYGKRKKNQNAKRKAEGASSIQVSADNKDSINNQTRDNV